MEENEFRMIFFRGSHLERWETLHAGSVLEALEHAATRLGNDKVELWLSGKRIALFRAPLGRSR